MRKVGRTYSRLNIATGAAKPGTRSSVTSRIGVLGGTVGGSPSKVTLTTYSRGSIVSSLGSTLRGGVPMMYFSSNIPSTPRKSMCTAIMASGRRTNKVTTRRVCPTVGSELKGKRIHMNRIGRSTASTGVSRHNVKFVGGFVRLTGTSKCAMTIMKGSFCMGRIGSGKSRTSTSVVLRITIPTRAAIRLYTARTSGVVGGSSAVTVFKSGRMSTRNILATGRGLGGLKASRKGVIKTKFSTNTILGTTIGSNAVLNTIARSPLVRNGVSVRALTGVYSNRSMRSIAASNC